MFMLSSSRSNRWAFLFDKVMMVCKKVTIRLGINVRYSPKHIFPVSDLRVETIDSSHRGKVQLVSCVYILTLCSPLSSS